MHLLAINNSRDVSELQAKFENDDDRWQAVEAKNTEADGQFYTGVLTTGIYCRPSCGARTPKRENIRFYRSAAAAEKDGLRACKRCKPNVPEQWLDDQKKVMAACRYIEHAEFEPSLEEIANEVNLSAYHFHRIFKKIIGLTPKQYATAHRQKSARKSLKTSPSVTDAIYAAGYGASSRFYQKAGQFLGMTPQEFKNGGRGKTVRYAIEKCDLGLMLVAATNKGICFLQFGDTSSELEQNLQKAFPFAQRATGDTVFAGWVKSALTMVEEGNIKGGSLIPVDIQGTAFQQRVWQALQTIPAGHLVTYKELAEQLKQPKAHRAVANACARNPVALVVPCHRVVRCDGSLSGYRWGVERKRKLINKEKAAKSGG